MKVSIKKGFGFGLTSGIITTLGVLVGLHASTHSAFIVMGGIILIAIADALSDSLSIHISEESEIKHSTKEIWETTIVTFFSKLLFALTFIIPILLFQLSTAIIISVIWGLSLISIFSFYIAKKQNVNPCKAVIEHLFIAILVIFITHFIGDWVSTFI